MSHKKCGPDRFSRFDVYWIQTNKHPDKPNLHKDYIKSNIFINLKSPPFLYLQFRRMDFFKELRNDIFETLYVSHKL